MDRVVVGGRQAHVERLHVHEGIIFGFGISAEAALGIGLLLVLIGIVVYRTIAVVRGRSSFE